MSEHSIVYWYSSLEKHMCGYCKNKKGNINHDMWAKYLTPEDYQNLIDRGWRRSGHYCYKPIMDQVCCPMYTIKCDALNFQLSKSQKKVIKKFNKFLNDGELNKVETQYNESGDTVSDFVYREAPKQVQKSSIVEVEETTETVNTYEKQLPTSLSPVNKPQIEKSKPKSGVGADPTKPPCKKAKLLRKERKKEKLLQKGISLEKTEVKNEQKSLEDFLNEAPKNGKHKFKLELIHTDSKDWERVKKIEFELYKKYQMIVHNDPPEKCKMESFLRFLVHSPVQITLERIDENHRHFRLTANLFAKYQTAVHNETPEECTDLQYINFLINSPLQYVRFSQDSHLGYGSFHQLYWLDDKLIAVGVIDILPKCVSAVYFFYDPDYRDLTLGTYGSLREVEFTRSLHKKIPTLQNYYMGFYIHSCPKMRYKGKLAPSYLLCPETYHWIPIENCLPKLEVSKYSRLSDESATDENSCSESDIDQMKILMKRKVVRFRQYKTRFGGEAIFKTIGDLVGKKCSKTLILVGEENDD